MKHSFILSLLLAALLLLPLSSSSFLPSRHEGDSKERGERERGREERERERERERGRGQRREEEEGRRGERPEIDLGQPKEILKSEGGRARVWSERVDAIRNTQVGVAELELEQDGLLVPHYTDADKIAYVLQGRGMMGAVIPGAQSEFRRTFIRRVEKGDVVALPKGTVFWWYNDGNERHRLFCAGDTTFGANPGRTHQFGLAGGKQSGFGSLLHGFSRDTLATAWGVDERTVQSLLEGQNDAGIVKVQQKIRFPEMPHERRSEDDEENHYPYYDRPASSFYFEELKYSMRAERPDFFVRDGGWLNIVNHHKLPALRNVGFSAMRVSLEKNAMCAPAFVRNAHQLLYIIKGGGRIQVASGDGQTVFDETVREGTLLVIPQFFPSLKIAGNQGMEWINLLTSDVPSTSFLAGRNSVYRGIPKQVVAAAFNVDEGKLKELGRDQEIIFPPRSGREQEEREGRRKREEEEPAWATL